MSKKKKIVLIALGSVALFCAVLVALAAVLITPERVREAVVPLAERALERKVDLGAIDVSLFSGITLQDVAIRQKSGDENFVAADRVVLRYSLLALLRLRVEIDEITLVRPQIEIIRNRDGSFNFSDLVGSREGDAPPSPAYSPAAGSGIDLHVSRIGISDGRLLFIDHSGQGKPQRHEIKAFNLRADDVSLAREFPLEMSADWNGNSLGIAGKVDPVKAGGDLEASFNRVRLHAAGGVADEKLSVALELPQTPFADLLASIPREYAPDVDNSWLQGSVTCSVSVDGDTLRTSGFVVDINSQTINLELGASNLNGEVVKVSLSAVSDSLDIDRLIPPSGRSAPPAKERGDQAPAVEIGPFKIPLELDGTVRVGRAVYQGVPVADLGMKVSLKDNLLRLENLHAVIAGGTFRKSGSVNLGVKGLTYASDIEMTGIRGGEIVGMVKPELAASITGTLGGRVKVTGAGTLPEAVKKRLAGTGTLRLEDGRLKSIPALDATAALLNIAELREIILDDGSANFIIRDGRARLDSRISGPKSRVTTSGEVGLNGALDLRSQLALSPELGGRLHAEGRLARYLGDESGWTTVPLRIKGSYDDPDVGLDSKGLKKQAEKAVEKEVEKKLEKELQRGLKKLFGN